MLVSSILFLSWCNIFILYLHVKLVLVSAVFFFEFGKQLPRVEYATEINRLTHT